MAGDDGPPTQWDIWCTHKYIILSSFLYVRTYVHMFEYSYVSHRTTDTHAHTETLICYSYMHIRTGNKKYFQANSVKVRYVDNKSVNT